MKIQIDGSGSVNKGAQLMLAAVLQEIRCRFPNAQVIINDKSPCESFIKKQYGDNYRFVRSPYFYKIVSLLHVRSITKRISNKLDYFFSLLHAIKGVDVILNVGGFQFGDQWNHNENEIGIWEIFIKKLHKNGTKIFFLPQAFGPFEKDTSKRMINVILQNADLIIARDDVSYNYLKSEGANDKNVLLYPDFTTSVSPVLTSYSLQNAGRVCIIPNSMIIRTRVMKKDEYIKSISSIIEHIYQKGKEVTLLNHEGIDDYQLCLSIASNSKRKILVISNLDATETKGVISTSYFVISSRFHGVANALSCGVPCLATSWSHKYIKLLEEYGQEKCLLDLSNLPESISKIDNILDNKVNFEQRNIIDNKNKEVVSKNKEMWDFVWNKK